MEPFQYEFVTEPLKRWFFDFERDISNNPIDVLIDIEPKNSYLLSEMGEYAKYFDINIKDKGTIDKHVKQWMQSMISLWFDDFVYSDKTFPFQIQDSDINSIVSYNIDKSYAKYFEKINWNQKE